MRGTEREQILFNHGNLFNTNCFSDEERKIEEGRVWGTVREERETGREREREGGGKVSLVWSAFSHNITSRKSLKNSNNPKTQIQTTTIQKIPNN